MSNDLVCLVTEGGTVREFWSRWGAISIQGDLLQGEQAFLSYVRGLDAIEPIELFPWMCALVMVDRDARSLAVWVRMGSLQRLALLELVRHRWPGWRVSAIGSLEGLPGAELQALSPFPLDFVLEEQTRWWLRMGGPEAAQGCDEAKTRDLRLLLEGDDHRCCVTMRDVDGSLRHDHWDGGHPCGRMLAVGLDGMRRIFAARLDMGMPLGWDGRFEAGAHVDVPAQTLSVWQETPAFPYDLRFALTESWPDWNIVEWETALDHVRALGLPPSAMWGPHTERKLDEWFAQLVGPRPSGAAVLATAVRGLSLEPGQTVRLADPGSPVGPDPQDQGDLHELFLQWKASMAPPDADASRGP